MSQSLSACCLQFFQDFTTAVAASAIAIHAANGIGLTEFLMQIASSG